MRLSDIQPQYFPRLHYFARMLSSDIFVLRDDVQFVRNHKYPDGKRGVSYQAHTPIKSPEGNKLLPVSIKKNGLLSIREMHISYDQPWAKKQINIIQNSYRKSPNYNELLPDIEFIYAQEYPTVGELNLATICWGLTRLMGGEQINLDSLTLDCVNKMLKKNKFTRLNHIYLGAELFGEKPSQQLSATGRIVELCKRLKADEYVGGGTAFQAYVDTSMFEKAGINLIIQEWDCPTYPQQYNKNTGFITNLSIIDLLMNVAPERGIQILVNN